MAHQCVTTAQILIDDRRRIPLWLLPLIDNCESVTQVCRQQVAPEFIAFLDELHERHCRNNSVRDAAVLILITGPDQDEVIIDEEISILITVRSSTMRHHSGQPAFPGGAYDCRDNDLITTALREAQEETGIEPNRVLPLVLLPSTFVAPSNFCVTPVVAYSKNPGSVRVVNSDETSHVIQVPVGQFINPNNRCRVYRDGANPDWAMPAFSVENMQVWGFTAQLISAVLEMIGWAQPWDTNRVYSLSELIAQTMFYSKDNG